MTDVLGFGVEKRRQVMGDIAKEKVHFRDGFRQMLESISERHTFQEGQALLKRGVLESNLYTNLDGTS